MKILNEIIRIQIDYTINKYLQNHSQYANLQVEFIHFNFKSGKDKWLNKILQLSEIDIVIFLKRNFIKFQ